MWELFKKQKPDQAAIDREAKQFAEKFSENIISRALPAINNSGVEVTQNTVLNSVHVFACARAIAETMATLPFPTYRSLQRGKERVSEHPVHQMLNESPDGVIPAVNFTEAGLFHCNTWGNWYSEIERFRSNEVKSLHLLPPSKVSPERKSDGTIQYRVSGSRIPIPADRMLHVPGPGFDGVVGFSPTRLAANAIGLGMATERFGAAWFGNGSRGQAVLRHPQTLSDAGRSNLREQVETVHQGPDKAHRLLLLEEGMALEQIGVPPEDAQFLQTRLFQLQEICRFFRVPPVIVQDLSNGTYSNTEQQMAVFVTQCLRPWARRIECEVNRKLFSEEERQAGFFCEFILDALLRGDIKTRYECYAIGKQWGWLNSNDICELENRNPLPGDQGDFYLVPTNYVSAEIFAAQAKQLPEPEPEPPVEPVEEADQEQAETESEADQESIQNSLPLFPMPSPEAFTASLDCVKDNVNRMLRREVEAIQKASQKPEKFLDAIEGFYSTHSSWVERAMEPSVKVFAALKAMNEPGKGEKLDSVFATLTFAKAIQEQLVSSGKNELLELSGLASKDDLEAKVKEWAITRVSKGDEIVSLLNTYQHEPTH